MMFKFHDSCPPTIVSDTLLDKATAPTLPDVMGIFTARKRSLRRLCFYRCLSFILFTGGGVRGRGGVHGFIGGRA